MTYETYLGLSREEVLEKVRAVMSEKRFQHVLGLKKPVWHWQKPMLTTLKKQV